MIVKGIRTITIKLNRHHTERIANGLIGLASWQGWEKPQDEWVELAHLLKDHIDRTGATASSS